LKQGPAVLTALRPPRPTQTNKIKALTRFDAAMQADDDHPDADLTIAALVADEMTRRPAPNRTDRRRDGERSGWTRKRYVLGQMARQEALLDAIEADPIRLARRNLQRSEAAKRRERKAARATTVGKV
jgi:hypothetical protein